MGRKRVLFISNSTYPSADAGGGSVVVFRHLSRLKAEGYDILVVNMGGVTLSEAQSRGLLPFINLQRKWWYPPLRKATPLLTALRIWFYELALLRRLPVGQGDDIILGLLGEYSNLLVERLHDRYQIPYLLFFHDDTLFNRYREQNLLDERQVGRILKKAAFTFAVSEPMARLVQQHGSSRCGTLYPIPEAQEQNFSQRPGPTDQLHFIISGMIEPIHFDIIKRLAAAVTGQGGQLSVISQFNGKPADFPVKGIGHIERFRTVKELVRYLQTAADVLVVFYSFDPEHEPRMLSSFPSKLLEFCQAGLPVLIVAPSFSTLGRWAAEANWLSFVNDDSEITLANMIAKLRDEEFRAACARQSQEIALTDFNPEHIHRAFSSRVAAELAAAKHS